jgi:hypothetical protein
VRGAVASESSAVCVSCVFVAMSRTSLVPQCTRDGSLTTGIRISSSSSGELESQPVVVDRLVVLSAGAINNTSWPWLRQPPADHTRQSRPRRE